MTLGAPDFSALGQVEEEEEDRVLHHRLGSTRTSPSAGAGDRAQTRLEPRMTMQEQQAELQVRVRPHARREARPRSTAVWAAAEAPLGIVDGVGTWVVVSTWSASS